MDSAAHSLLRRACAAVQRYDSDGSATVPMIAWPNILEDLELQEDSSEAEIVKEHFDLAGEGRITYRPLLQALGVPLPGSAPSAGAQQESSVGQSPQPRAPTSLDLQQLQEADDAPQPAEIEDAESFWSNRASSIQRLYRLWDCNQLSNETFSQRLQEVVGPAVSICDEDSEFVKLTNQHRFARNLKFNELMVALRRDARRCGYSFPGSPSNSVFASSLAEFTPSEAPSDYPAHFAGRPSALQATRARQHYTPSEVDDVQSVRGSLQWETDPARVPRKLASRGGYGDNSGQPSLGVGAALAGGYDMLGRPPSAPSDVRRAPAPRAPFATDSAEPELAATMKGPRPGILQSVAQAANANRGAMVPDQSFWNRSGPVQQMAARRDDKQFDTGSQYGAQSEVSVADSQREIFNARNRGGHGNILTWGTDSRSITPAKQRQGRQLAASQGGSPTQAASIGAFPSA